MGTVRNVDCGRLGAQAFDAAKQRVKVAIGRFFSATFARNALFKKGRHTTRKTRSSSGKGEPSKPTGYLLRWL